MLKAVIIDDEKASREALHGLLKRYCKNVELIGQADGYNSGIELLKTHKPDVVFLDIQMPDGTGFKLLEDIENIDFEVIFSTAFDQYAIKAIKYSALDYLLKPVNPEDLINSIDKLEEKLKRGKDNINIRFLIDSMKNKGNESKKIVLSTSEGMHIVEIDNIIRCESEDYYTKFFFNDGKSIMVSRTLKENEEMLSDYNFIRSHKSHLVNIRYIKSFLKMDGGSILMKDGTHIPVSRRKRELVMNILTHL